MFADRAPYTDHNHNPGGFMDMRIAFAAALSASLVCSTALAFDQQGSSGGSFVSLLDPTSARTLLGSFWFDFSDGDHHIKNIGTIARVSPDRTFIHYNDKNSDDSFTYFVRQPTVGNTVIERRLSIATSENCQNPGLCRTTIGTMAGYTFVLQGFYMSFEGTDHHIDRIAVYESGGVLTVAYNDKNDDDFFGAIVEYAWVPNNLIAATGSDGGVNSSLAAIDNVPSTGDFVIRGFDFDFTSSDHHLNSIGISRWNVMYADWNHDDNYAWNVRWATLRPALVFEVDVVAPMTSLAQ